MRHLKNAKVIIHVNENESVVFDKCETVVFDETVNYHSQKAFVNPVLTVEMRIVKSKNPELNKIRLEKFSSMLTWPFGIFWPFEF